MYQHQIVAIVKDRKAALEKATTEAYHVFQKPDLFAGHVNSYRPTREDEAQIPPDKKRPQRTVSETLGTLAAAIESGYDAVLTQDVGNQKAAADLSVKAGAVSLELKAVPATHLLFLEKQAESLLTMIAAVPVLDDADEWKSDQGDGLFRTEPQEALRTRKVQKPLVLYDATENHPAQTQVISEDIPVGVIQKVRLSGAISRNKKAEMLARATAFREGVKQARERANTTEVTAQSEGRKIFDFIFGG